MKTFLATGVAFSRPMRALLAPAATFSVQSKGLCVPYIFECGAASDRSRRRHDVARGSVNNDFLLFKEVPFWYMLLSRILRIRIYESGSYKPGSYIILCMNVNLNPDPVLYTDLYAVLINLFWFWMLNMNP
jgi:hypothetical protein